MDEELLSRFGGDAGLLRELAELFIQSCPKMLEDIRDAVQKRDAKALERAAHSLKGCVGNFFSKGARETAQRLELVGSLAISRALKNSLTCWKNRSPNSTAC